MKRLLLCRTDAVGDLILTLPVARSLKEVHPELQITLLAAKYTAPLLAGEEYLDNIVTIPTRSLHCLKEIGALARDLRRMQFDAAVLFYPRLSLALATYLAKIPLRVGTGRRAYSVLFNERVNLHRRDSGKHELDLNYELAEAHFQRLRRFEPSLSVTTEERDGAKDLLGKIGIGDGESFVVVHPLSHGSAPNWRIERYVKLIRLLSNGGTKVVVTGSQLEASDLSAALGDLPGGVYNIAGTTDLSALKAIINRAALLVAGSTGPIHIAGAVGTFAVGIYPPESALSPVRWGPRGSANKLFQPSVDNGESNSMDLMDTIAVEQVSEFIINQLSADTRTRVNNE